MSTPYDIRIALTRQSRIELERLARNERTYIDEYIRKQGFRSIIEEKNYNVSVDLLRDLYSSCAEDVLAVRNHRDTCDDVYDFTKFRSNLRLEALNESQKRIVHGWLDDNRDFKHTAAGVRLLQERYLRRREEPIQFAMLRIANTLASSSSSGQFRRDGTIFVEMNEHAVERYMDLLKVFYDALSLCMIHVSSILAYSDSVDPSSSSPIVPGEACRLMICEPTYDNKFVMQMERVKTIISLGVGVGLGASTVPRNGIERIGCIKSGFIDFVRSLDSCNYLSLHTRRPKIAVYVHIDVDTVYDTFELKKPVKERVKNVFFGLLINDYFIDRVLKNENWYLFPGQLKHEGESLRDHDNDTATYIATYERFVRANLYTKVVKACDLMASIIVSLRESGNPYIIWIDHVNRYNNQRHLGPIRTLNLCAEITNYCDSYDSSSCMLISVNMSTFNEHVAEQRNMWSLIQKHYTFADGDDDADALLETENFSRERLNGYSYRMGFMATVALNNVLGVDRKRREIGVNPFGMFDAAVISSNERDSRAIDARETCALASEMLYKGCVSASCTYSRVHNVLCENYPGSGFSRGEPQWRLRDVDPKTDWSALTSIHMKRGMANSMLISQAPTATTSLFTGACESVTLPPDLMYSRESANGRNRVLIYGVACRLLRDKFFDCRYGVNNDISRQVDMYAVSAPYVDHSQSTMFVINTNTRSDKQHLYDLLALTHKSGLKTGIYYIIPKNTQEVLTTVRHMCDQCTL